MHKLLAIGALGLSALMAPLGSQAHVDVGVSIGVPLYGAPYYYAPGPVWRGPAVVYREVPRPYYGPRYYYGGYHDYRGRPYQRGYREGYRDGRHDGRRSPRGDWRDRDDGYRHRH